MTFRTYVFRLGRKFFSRLKVSRQEANLRSSEYESATTYLSISLVRGKFVARTALTDSIGGIQIPPNREEPSCARNETISESSRENRSEREILPGERRILCDVARPSTERGGTESRSAVVKRSPA